ncbi:hypothetical protein ACLWBD_12875 [Bdellovibrio sp. HCB117]|uniref:hypothetical protein n=1 Tax=Bdellovibrio sp. HCB117 TaxID=3394359 RepID=UPI0039B40F48
MRKVLSFVVAFLVLSPLMAQEAASPLEVGQEEIQSSLPEATAPAASVPATSSVPSVNSPPALAPSASAPVQSAVATSQTPTNVSYKVKQIIRSHNVVIVEASQPIPLEKGKLYLVTLKDGTQCSLSLADIESNLLTMESADCTGLVVGMPVEPALLKASGKTVESTDILLPEADKTGPRVSVSLYYSTATQARFEDTYVSTTSGSGYVDTTYTMDSSAGLGVSYSKLNLQSWGFVGSILWEPKRKIKSLEVEGPGGTVSGDLIDSPELTLLIFEGNIAYRWENIYIPFGLNYSAPFLSYNSSTTWWSVSGALGAYVGLGMIMSPNFTLELFIRSVGLEMTAADSTGTIDFKRGSLAGFGAGWKYTF